MFWLIRLIFLLFILGMGYSWFKWKTTAEGRWLKHFRTLLSSTLLLAISIATVLVLTRLLR